MMFQRSLCPRLTGAVALLAAASSLRCEPDACTSNLPSSIEVRVIAAGIETDLCEGGLVVHHGDATYETPLTCPGQMHTYGFGMDEPGIFEVTATAPGYAQLTKVVEVKDGGCHVKTEAVTLALEENPAPRCGDGNVDQGEECDMGAQNSDAPHWAYCQGDCTLPRCGDGKQRLGEVCDDGNDNNFDSCGNDCFSGKCGDGMVDAGEQCDDGNTIEHDSCRLDCTTNQCGNSSVDVGESCDDGNRDDGDSCPRDCGVHRCGDGVQDSGEECDLGRDNTDSIYSKACRSDCRLAICGDGKRTYDELCDDGNTIDGDGCSADCATP